MKLTRLNALRLDHPDRPLAEQVRRATLAWVNEQRAIYRLGEPLLDLPAGRQRCLTICPLARALQASVARDYARLDGGHGRRLVLPTFVRQFISFYDCGYYPDLIERTG